MTDSPSIVPDLTDLIALVGRYSTNCDAWETETILAKLREQEQAISERAPHLAFPAHALVEGALYLRRQSESTREARQKKEKERRETAFRMAAECIARRRDPAYDDMSDIRLMEWVGALPPYGRAKSQARAMILAGMRDPRNIEKIKQFGARRETNRRRSIFDGTKDVP